VSRFFTLKQAERLLKEVEPNLRQAAFLKSEYQNAVAELQRLSQHIAMSGGVSADRDKFVFQNGRRDSSAAQLKEAIEKIQDSGCLVKDLDIGLIDFPTLFRNREAYLCWRLGETAIEFWHFVDEGFRGRKKIDQDFLDNHKGDAAH
jgi:hypothetical protein